jgi:Protein of unknown function (DUF3105)
MADTRKPKSKPTGQGGGSAPKGRQQARRGAPAPGKGKLAKGAAARRLEAKRRRQRALAWTIGTVVALGALVGVVVLQGGDDEDRVSPEALAAGRQAGGCGDIRTFPVAGRAHIQPNQQPTDWNSTPPTSGQHLATPLAPGVYDQEQDERAIVHNLEHGYVVIQYKNIPEDQLVQLREYVQDRSGSKLVLAPWSGLERDGVALTAWQNLQTCERVNLDAVKGFVSEFMVPGGARSTAPEPLAA